MYAKVILILASFIILLNNIICLANDSESPLENSKDEVECRDKHQKYGMFSENTSNPRFMNELREGLSQLNQVPVGECISSLYNAMKRSFNEATKHPNTTKDTTGIPARIDSFGSIFKSMYDAGESEMKKKLLSPKYDYIDDNAKCDGREGLHFVVRGQLKGDGPCRYSGKCKLIEKIVLVSLIPSKNGNSIDFRSSFHIICDCFQNMDHKYFNQLNCSCINKKECSCYEKMDYIYFDKFSYGRIRNNVPIDQENESENMGEDPITNQGYSYGPKSSTKTIENDPTEGHPYRASKTGIACDNGTRPQSDDDDKQPECGIVSGTGNEGVKLYSICAKDNACCKTHLVYALLNDGKIKQMPTFTYPIQ